LETSLWCWLDASILCRDGSVGPSEASLLTQLSLAASRDNRDNRDNRAPRKGGSAPTPLRAPRGWASCEAYANVRAAHRKVVRQIDELTRHDVRPDNRGGSRRVQIPRDSESAKKPSKLRQQEIALRKQMSQLLQQERTLKTAAGARERTRPSRRDLGERPGAADKPPEGCSTPVACARR